MNVIVNKCVYVCVHMSIYDPHHSYLYISYANAKCVFREAPRLWRRNVVACGVGIWLMRCMGETLNPHPVPSVSPVPISVPY